MEIKKNGKKIICTKLIPIFISVSIFSGLIFCPSTVHAAAEYDGKSGNDFTKDGVHYLLKDESLYIYEKEGTNSPWPSKDTNKFNYNESLSNKDEIFLIFQSLNRGDIYSIKVERKTGIIKIFESLNPSSGIIEDVADFSQKNIYLQNYRPGMAIGTPDMPYYRTIFPDGTYNFDIVNIDKNSKKPPFTRISANSDKGVGRTEEFVFTLNKCNYRKGYSLEDRVYFYFVATKPDGHERLAIRVDNDGNLSYLMLTGKTLFKDDVDVGGKWLAQGGYNEFLSAVFDNGPYSWAQRKMPESKYLNNDVLKNWGITCSVQESPGIDDALIGVAKLVNTAISSILNQLTKYLTNLLLIPNLQKNTAVVKTWKIVRDISNLLLIIGLLLIALFNVMRFQIEYYTAKALIPRLVIAAIFINFSLLLTQAILDLGNILVSYLIAGANFTNIISINAESGAVGLGLALGTGLALYFFSGFVLVAALVAIIMVLAVLILRISLIWVLAIFSPLIFLFSVLPFTRGLTSIWWNYFTKYVFMGTVIAVILRVAAEISNYGAGTPTASDQFIRTLTIIILLIAAAVSPFVLGDKLAGAVTSKIGDWTKGWKKSRLASSRGGAALAARRKDRENRAFERAQARRTAGAFGWKDRTAGYLSRRSQRRGTEGIISSHIRQRLSGSTVAEQKALQDRADQLQAAGGYDIMQRLIHGPAITARQKFDQKAATLGLIKNGETERLALTRQQQRENSIAQRAYEHIHGAGTWQDHMNPNQVGPQNPIPYLSDPTLVSAAVEKGAYHLISNPNIRRGVWGKLGSSPERIANIASEAIKFEQAGILKEQIDGRTAVEMLRHSDSRRRKAFLGRYNDLSPAAQRAIDNELATNPDLAQYNRPHRHTPSNNPALREEDYPQGTHDPNPHNPHRPERTI